MGDRAKPRRRAARDGDPHAVRPDERDVRGGAQHAELGACPGARLAVLGAKAGNDQQACTGCDRLARGSGDRNRSHRQRAHVRGERKVPGSRHDGRSLGRPTRAVDGNGLGVKAQAQPEM